MLESYFVALRDSLNVLEDLSDAFETRLAWEETSVYFWAFPSDYHVVSKV